MTIFVIALYILQVIEGGHTIFVHFNTGLYPLNRYFFFFFWNGAIMSSTCSESVIERGWYTTGKYTFIQWVIWKDLK